MQAVDEAYTSSKCYKGVALDVINPQATAQSLGSPSDLRKMPDKFAIRGNIVHAPVFGSISLMQQATLVIEGGVISHIGGAGNESTLLAQQGLERSSVLHLQVLR